MVKKQNVVIWIQTWYTWFPGYRHGFMVFIKTGDICKDIAEDVEIRFDTSSYELDRPLPKGKNKKIIGLIKDELGERFCCIKSKN